MPLSSDIFDSQKSHSRDFEVLRKELLSHARKIVFKYKQENFLHGSESYNDLVGDVLLRVITKYKKDGVRINNLPALCRKMMGDMLKDDIRKSLTRKIIEMM